MAVPQGVDRMQGRLAVPPRGPGRRGFFVASILCALAPAPSLAQPAPDIVAVYGDSLAQGVGFMLNQALLRDARFRVVNRGRPATALGQPTYNWIEAVRTSLRQDRPGYAVMMFGGNDRLAMRRPGGNGHVAFGSEAWVELYRARLETMLQDVADAGVPVIWCGNPIAREARYSRDMRFLNDIYRSAVEARGQIYIDTWAMFADDQGRFAEALRTHRGTVARVRAEDGIHMTAIGYDMIARRVLARLEALHAAGAARTAVASS